jgi:(1->4)-alpha-D-glucan 1-alpha-D-glucosylmutase
MTRHPLVATYRLQLRPGFGFDEAAAIVDYLADLGVSHVYCSPYLQAAPGSTHGYDVVDHSRVNDELGGPEAHARFCAAVADAGLGQVLDIVPNHMAVVAENAWWTDVLENGPASRWAGHFDVDWNPPERKLRNTVLVPVLGDHYGRVLDAGEIVVERTGGSFRVRYHDHVLPLAPPTYDALLEPAASETGCDELAFLAGAFASLPRATRTDPESAARRHRDKEVLKARLDELLERDPAVREGVDRQVAAVGRDADRLDALLERQNYRLAYWRTAGQELDYRRFFDVTSLAGLRVEDPVVFSDTHDLVLQWARDGVLDGLRIDHIDGLADPGAYLERLRAAAPDVWLLVEKIVLGGEQLPSSWPVDGTTGYEHADRILHVFVDQVGEEALTRAYGEFTGETVDWAHTAQVAKHHVLERTLAADVHRLTNILVQVCEAERRWRDFTRPELEGAIVEAIACFDVYRTYVRPGSAVTEGDATVIEGALARVKERRSDLDPELFELLARVLRGELGGPAGELCVRFQQTSGPAMAKGVEDTGLYRFNRLTALNEVGGDPGTFARPASDLHRWFADVESRAPRSMTAGSTHDSKRSEDVRARIALLAECPDDFAAAVARWSAGVAALDLGDRNLEWLLYQTLVGAHPLPADRAVAYALKAAREAKQRTSWTEPDVAYEAAVERFVNGALDDEDFVSDLDRFVSPLVGPGWVKSLAMHTVRMLAPGVPDIYQGTELWDLSLVDPDNRRPVDFDRRRRLLADLAGLAGLDAAAVWARAADGLPKLLVTVRSLELRRRPLGTYRPIECDDAAFGFTRGDELAVVVPRFPLRMANDEAWYDDLVRLPAGRWRDVITNTDHEGVIRLAGLLDGFPVAVLAR